MTENVSGGRGGGVAPLGVFETKPQNLLEICPEGGTCGHGGCRRALAGGRSEVVRDPPPVTDDRRIGTGKQISLFFFIFGSVSSQLKLLQLRTAHQSVTSVFFLFKWSPPLVERAALGPEPCCGNGRGVAFSCCVCSVCTTSFLCLSPCDCICE